MTILKTYARLFVENTEIALPLYEELVGKPADLRFDFEGADLAAVGNFLIIGGPSELTDRFRSTIGPVIVDDVDALVTHLLAAGARVDDGPLESDTGVFYYLTHPDGVSVEYVQWSPEIAGQVFDSIPHRE